MYLHTGCNELVDVNDVVALFDYEAWSNGRENREAAQMMRVEGEIRHISDGDRSLSEKDSRSVIICHSQVLFSPITTTTLRRRLRRSTFKEATYEKGDS